MSKGNGTNGLVEKLSKLPILVAEKLENLECKFDAANIKIERLDDISNTLSTMSKTLTSINNQFTTNSDRAYQLTKYGLIGVFILVVLSMGKESFLQPIVSKIIGE